MMEFDVEFVKEVLVDSLYELRKLIDVVIFMEDNKRDYVYSRLLQVIKSLEMAKEEIERGALEV